MLPGGRLEQPVKSQATPSWVASISMTKPDKALSLSASLLCWESFNKIIHGKVRIKDQWQYTLFPRNRLGEIMIIVTAKTYTLYDVLGTFLRTLHILPDVVLKQPYDRYYCYPHLMEEEAKVTAQGHGATEQEVKPQQSG